MTLKKFGELQKRKVYRDPKNVRRYAEKNPISELSGEPGAQVHHIHPKKMGGGYVDDRDCNLITLTVAEHAAAHGPDAEYWQEVFLKIKELKGEKYTE